MPARKSNMWPFQASPKRKRVVLSKAELKAIGDTQRAAMSGDLAAIRSGKLKAKRNAAGVKKAIRGGQSAGRETLKLYDSVGNAVWQVTGGIPRRIAGALVGEKNPTQYRVVECASASKEHACSVRQYAHTFHKQDKNKICVTPEFWNLPEEIRLGILLHEVGHIAAGEDGTECDANKKAKELTGITVKYADSRFGKNLEFVQAKDIDAAREFLGQKVPNAVNPVRGITDWATGGDMPDWVNNPKRIAAAFRNALRNPNDAESAAIEMYKSFHGKDPEGSTKIVEELEQPDWLAPLGVVVSFKCATLSGYDLMVGSTDTEAERMDFDEALADAKSIFLGANGDGTQLYFVGGDQSVDLGRVKMGEGSDWYRDDMIVGVLYEITYRTKKKFDKFKLTDYFHHLGEETGDQPMLRYDPLSPHLYVSGGKYKIKMPLIGMSPGIEN